jgi:hypothetical protein
VFAVDPRQAALGLGTEEAVLHELLGGEVELAGDIGIGTAGRQRDQAALIGRAQAIGAVPDPLVFVLAPSALFSASRSSTVSHAGFGLRYSASVVRRHRPRSCCLSFQKL